MSSTYDKRQQPSYMNEGRLSRVKSGSTGALYNRHSRMDSNGYPSRNSYHSNASQGYSRMQITRDEDYIHAWCHHYGLTPATARVLSINGIETVDDLLRLDRHTINKLAIRDNEKLLFRGALLQFKQSDYDSARKQAAKGLRPHLLDRNHGISEDERVRRMELRLRLRRKRAQNHGGISLADRIIMQRREAGSSLSEPVGSTACSLPSIDQSDMVSSRSLRSYTDPVPRRTNSHHSVASKTSDYSSGSGMDSFETPQRVVKKKTVTKVDSSDDDVEKIVRKKDKKKKKKEDSDGESDVEEKVKKSKKKKDKVKSDSEDEDKEVKKKKKKKKKERDDESDSEENEKSGKKKKDKNDNDTDDEVKASRKKKDKKKTKEESDSEDAKKEKKKKKKKDKDKDLDSEDDDKVKKKKKKDKEKEREPVESDDEDKKVKKKKKKKKKERQESDEED